MVPLYPGDRVRVVTWPKSSFHGMQGRVVDPKTNPGRVLVHLDGDVASTLFFVRELVLIDALSEPNMSGAE